MRIRFVNAGRFSKAERVTIRYLLREVVEEIGVGRWRGVAGWCGKGSRTVWVPYGTLLVVLSRSKKAWHGRACYNTPIIRLQLPKPIWCAEELRFLVAHEYRHTLGLRHKDGNHEFNHWPCSCKPPEVMIS